MKTTRIDKAGLDLIKEFESFQAKPYLCPAAVPTIGYGTTRYPNGAKVSLSDRVISEAESESFLQHDVKIFELAVDSMAVDTITQNQFNALVSFAYNLGSSALKSSNLLRKVNINPADASITGEFMKWVYAAGKKLPGLERRRAAEAKLYFNK